MKKNLLNSNYKPTILVVDDEKINIDYIVKNFNENFTFKVTTKSTQVFDILEKNHIDLILLDIQMPEIDGFEIAKQIKQSDEYNNIPFMFLTSQTDTQSIIDGFDLGAIDYITKPFNLKELRARINTHSKNFILQEKIKEQQSEILLQSKFAAMGEMTSMLAHQWRQPLNVISLLVQEIDLDRQMNIFSKEEYENKKNLLLNTIVNLSSTIEDFSKYFKKDLFERNTNIIEVLTNLENLFKEKLNNNNINFTIQNNSLNNNLSLNISSRELTHIFSNIIQNSIEAIEVSKNNDSFINIVLDLKKDFICIDFFDNGVGIDDKIKDSMFEPYVTTKSNLNGPGLGLYTSKMIIENYLNGTIQAKNTDKGTKVSIKIKTN